MFDNNLSIFWY